MKKFSELKEAWAPAQGHKYHSKTNDELRALETVNRKGQEAASKDNAHQAHVCGVQADIARAILNHRATSRNRDMKESTWEIYKQKALNESATPLKTGQMVKIASGYGSGTEGRLGSINSRTGEAIIFPTPLIPMMTHIKYLKALHESALNVKTLSAEEIAQKHGVSLDTIKDQIAKGIKVEHEHATSDQTAEEIARDHLGERPDYYEKLDKANLEEAAGRDMIGPRGGSKNKKACAGCGKKSSHDVNHGNNEFCRVCQQIDPETLVSKSTGFYKEDLKAQWNTDFTKDSYARRKNLRQTIKQQLNPKTPGLGNKAWTRADKEDKKNRPYTYSMQTANESVKDKTLHGHPYHHKSDAELHYIIKDAGEAERAIGSHDKKAMWKYGDQQSDAASVLAYRRRGGKRIPEPFNESGDHLAQFSHHWAQFKLHDNLSNTDRTHLTQRNHHEREMNKHYLNLTTQQKNNLRLKLDELHDEPDRPGTGIGVSGDGTEKGMAMTEDGPSTKKTITKAEWDHHTRHATAQFDTEGQRWIVQQDATGSATRIPVNVTEDYPYRQTIRRVLREAFPMAPKSTEKPDNTQDDEEKGEAPKAKKEKAIDPVVIGKSKDKFEADPILTPVLSVANMPGGSVR